MGDCDWGRSQHCWHFVGGSDVDQRCCECGVTNYVTEDSKARSKRLMRLNDGALRRLAQS